MRDEIAREFVVFVATSDVNVSYSIGRLLRDPRSCGVEVGPSQCG